MSTVAAAHGDATVLAAYGRQHWLRADDGRERSAVTRGRRTDVVVGDRVAWHELGAGQAVIESVRPRRNALRRSDDRREKMIAANLDQAAVVLSGEPPFSEELLLRVQHILQRAYRAELSRTKPEPLQLGERCVDLNDAIVTLPEGKTLALTATELALLRKLAENRGHIVTYDALCAAVWGADYYGYENSLGVHIRHLREKLEAEPGTPQFLRTVRGIGYKLTKGEEA